MAKDGFTPKEIAAIQKLEEALKDWPETLAILSVDETLMVVLTSHRNEISVDPDRLFASSPRRTIPGVATGCW
jgi:hypothetical protein